MLFGESLTFECPDECPIDCRYVGDLLEFGQSSICCRCPVLVCKMPRTDEDMPYMPIVPPTDYRDDWAREWDRFFKDGTVPRLCM